MIDLLTARNFKAAGTCNCGGAYTQKFRCNTYLVRVRPRKYKFDIFNRGQRMIEWTDLKELENKLNEFFPINNKTVPAQAQV